MKTTTFARVRSLAARHTASLLRDVAALFDEEPEAPAAAPVPPPEAAPPPPASVAVEEPAAGAAAEEPAPLSAESDPSLDLPRWRPRDENGNLTVVTNAPPAEAAPPATAPVAAPPPPAPACKAPRPVVISAQQRRWLEENAPPFHVTPLPRPNALAVAVEKPPAIGSPEPSEASVFHKVGTTIRHTKGSDEARGLRKNTPSAEVPTRPRISKHQREWLEGVIAKFEDQNRRRLDLGRHYS